MADPRVVSESLPVFEPISAPLSGFLPRIDALLARYAEDRDRGRVLSNTVEAMRVELTYHSNAIEGNALSLRDTQVVLEGAAPPGGKSLREIYEARNHD